VIRSGRLPAALIFTLLGACAAGPRQDIALPERITIEDAGAAPTGTTPEPRVPSAQAQWQRHQDAVLALGTWRAKGKVAYRLPDEGGSANLAWTQVQDQTEARLSGPLGAGSTVIRNDGPLISVLRDGIERRYPADAAPWLSNGALLPIPIASIPFWLRGVPDPAAPAATLEVAGGLARRIEQDGWVVSIETYKEQDALMLPARLRIEAPSIGLTLRTILREWRLTRE